MLLQPTWRLSKKKVLKDFNYAEWRNRMHEVLLTNENDQKIVLWVEITRCVTETMRCMECSTTHGRHNRDYSSCDKLIQRFILKELVSFKS
jgi:hypothetical protein